MGEISKTAEAAKKAVERSQRKEAKELTVEERITNIRKNLDAGLYVPAAEIKVLLAMYDAQRVTIDGAAVAIELSKALVESNAHKATEELETIPR